MNAQIRFNYQEVLKRVTFVICLLISPTVAIGADSDITGYGGAKWGNGFQSVLGALNGKDIGGGKINFSKNLFGENFIGTAQITKDGLIWLTLITDQMDGVIFTQESVDRLIKSLREKYGKDKKTPMAGGIAHIWSKKSGELTLHYSKSRAIESSRLAQLSYEWKKPKSKQPNPSDL